MNKTISINPDLFKFASNRSRKKRSSDKTTGEIKIRTPKEKTKTLRKNHVLRFIRDQQEKNYKKLLEGDKATNIGNINSNINRNNSSSILGPGLDKDFNSDFDESLKYLMNLTEETDKKAKTASHNQTLKRYPNQDPGSLLFNPAINVLSPDVSLEMAGTLLSGPAMTLSQPKHFAPTWGCLKGGQLPTYRTYNNIQTGHNQTQRNYSGQVGGQPINPVIPNALVPKTMQSSSDQVNTSMVGGTVVSNNQDIPVNSVGSVNPVNSVSSFDIPVQTGGVNRFSEIKQTMQKVAQQKDKKQQKMRYPKQKRTVRRTYKVGKSKTQPKVTVLISNKTLRNKISTEAQLLKQTPIDDVKRFLTKRGFIKVGSSAPNDVLRKMHETASLMCGEIQNHNPDNLLYNFLND